MNTYAALIPVPLKERHKPLSSYLARYEAMASDAIAKDCAAPSLKSVTILDRAVLCGEDGKKVRDEEDFDAFVLRFVFTGE